MIVSMLQTRPSLYQTMVQLEREVVIQGTIYEGELWMGVQAAQGMCLAMG